MNKNNPTTISHSELMVILQKNRFHYKNENTYIQIRPTFNQGKPDHIDFVYVVYDRAKPSIPSQSDELILELGKFETSFELYEANEGIYFFKDIKKILSSYKKSINPIIKKNGFVEIKSLEEAEEVEESYKQMTKDNILKGILKETGADKPINTKIKMKNTNQKTVISSTELMEIINQRQVHYKNENIYLQIRTYFNESKKSIDFIYSIYYRSPNPTESMESMETEHEKLISELEKLDRIFKLKEINPNSFDFDRVNRIIDSFTKSINPIILKYGFVEIQSVEEANQIFDSSKQITKDNTLKEIIEEPSTDKKPKQSEGKKVDILNLVEKLADVLNIVKEQNRTLKTQPEPVKIQSNPAKDEPITISIQNTTNKTIENIKLFNYEHKDQNELRYSCAFMNYADVLRTIASYNPESGIELKRIRVMLNNIQANKSKSKIELKAVTSTIFGSSLSKPHELKVDKYQYQPNIFEGDFEYLLNVNSQIFIDEIQPFQEIIIHLFIEKK